MLIPASSICHQHILAIVNSELDRFRQQPLLRILDVGCGRGDLIAYLTANLPVLAPDIDVAIYGFEISDYHARQHGALQPVFAHLSARFPQIPWQERLSVITHADPWPWPDGFFDIILSNQVLEHVQDHDFVFAELQRTLAPGGVAAHLFSMREVIIEPHLFLPWLSRMRHRAYLPGYIHLLSRLGLGTFPRTRRETAMTPAEFARAKAEYINRCTHYLTAREIIRLGRQSGLRVSFGYTWNLYASKLRALAHLPARYAYTPRRSRPVDTAAMILLRYLADITLLMEREAPQPRGRGK